MALLHRIALAVSLGVAVLGPATALAEPAPAAERPTRLVVRVEAPAETVTAAAVRDAVARELSMPVADVAPEGERYGVLEVRVLASPKTARVEYTDPTGRTLIRTIDLPTDDDRAAETIALLAGSLVRDQTSELLRELERKEPPPAKPKPEDEPTPPPAPEAEPRALPYAPVDLALFHPIAWPLQSERHRVGIELALLYGRIGALEGAAISGVVSRIDGDATGAQISGVVGLVGGTVRGASGAGAVQLVRGDVQGVAGAGVVTAVQGKTEGVVIAPVALTGELSGVELSVVGISGPGEGAQLGVVNMAGDLRGAQLGLVNIGGTIDGTQIGVVNVADHVDGAAVGLVSVNDETRLHLRAYTSLEFPMNVALQILSGPVFSEIGGGFDFAREVGDRKRSLDVARFGGYLGAHAELGPVFLEPAVGFMMERPVTASSEDERLGVVGYRGVVGYQPFAGLGVFAGAELRQEIPQDTGSTQLGWDALAGVQVF